VKPANAIIDEWISNNIKFTKAYKIEPASYYGIFTGDEIMYCARRRKDLSNHFVLFRMIEPSSIYEKALTREGRNMMKIGPKIDKQYNQMVISFEPFDIPQSANSAEMWQELKRMDHFKYWSPPEQGPLKYVMESRKQAQIGLFRAFITTVKFGDLEKVPQSNNKSVVVDIINYDRCFTVEVLRNAKPVLPDDIYAKRKVQIYEIVQKYLRHP